MDWELKGTVIVACNCDYGCPCNFNARPTAGKCEGTWTWHVERGTFGETSLDNLNFTVCVNWPGAIHEGNGEALILVDERADEAQRKAIETLVGHLGDADRHVALAVRRAPGLLGAGHQLEEGGLAAGSESDEGSAKHERARIVSHLPAIGSRRRLDRVATRSDRAAIGPRSDRCPGAIRSPPRVGTDVSVL